MVLKSREKILLVFVVIAMAIWAFDRYYYTPQSRKILSFKGEIQAADQKMEQFLLLTKGVETVETEVARLEGEIKALTGRTLKGEEFRTFLRHLARESHALQMKIISITPQEEMLSLPKERKEPLTFQYRKVNVQMVLHSNYTKLGDYLRDIEKFPFLINVDRLEIERNEDILPLVKVTLGLSMYMVSL